MYKMQDCEDKMDKLICLLFGHSKKEIVSHDKDMFGYEYVWQRKWCPRCGERLN